MRNIVIPDWWLCGYLRGHPDATVADAMGWWMEQEQASPTPGMKDGRCWNAGASGNNDNKEEGVETISGERITVPGVSQ